MTPCICWAYKDSLLAAGDSLYWIDAYEGTLLCQYPPGKLGGPEQVCCRRGAMVAESLRGRIYGGRRGKRSTCSRRSRQAAISAGSRDLLARFLSPRRSTPGGTLVLAGNVLLVAGGDKLAAYLLAE